MLTPTQIILALAGAIAALLVFRMLGSLVRVKATISLTDAREVSKQIHEFVRSYMSGNYSGDPAQLASAMSGLLPQVREIATRRNPSIDDGLLRMLVAGSIAAHRIADRNEAEAAFDEALRLEQRAA